MPPQQTALGRASLYVQPPVWPRTPSQPCHYRGPLRGNRGGGAAERILFRLECPRHSAWPFRNAVPAYVPVPASAAWRGGRLQGIGAGADRRILQGCRPFAEGTRHKRRRRSEADEKTGENVLWPHRRLCRFAATRRRGLARGGSCPKRQTGRGGLAGGGASGRLRHAGGERTGFAAVRRDSCRKSFLPRCEIGLKGAGNE